MATKLKFGSPEWKAKYGKGKKGAAASAKVKKGSKKGGKKMSPQAVALGKKMGVEGM